MIQKSQLQRFGYLQRLLEVGFSVFTIISLNQEHVRTPTKGPRAKHNSNQQFMVEESLSFERVATAVFFRHSRIPAKFSEENNYIRKTYICF